MFVSLNSLLASEVFSRQRYSSKVNSATTTTTHNLTLRSTEN